MAIEIDDSWEVTTCIAYVALEGRRRRWGEPAGAETAAGPFYSRRHPIILKPLEANVVFNSKHIFVSSVAFKKREVLFFKHFFTHTFNVWIKSSVSYEEKENIMHASSRKKVLPHCVQPRSPLHSNLGQNRPFFIS